MADKTPFPFAKKEKPQESKLLGTWKILIVDDEEEVHKITRSVLSDFEYDNHGVEILSAYSGKEATHIMNERNDIALILLDVVMESDDAGLETARYIREELKNSFVQIVLRTGQPGMAPEKQIIRDYEINDYKEKTELTTTKLFTTVLTALRAYKNIVMIEKNRFGLEKILDATRSLYAKQSRKDFLEGVLTQIEALLRLNGDRDLESYHGFFAFRKGEFSYEILAATGKFKDHEGEIPPDVIENLDRAAKLKQSYLDKDIYVAYFSVKEKNIETFIYFQGRNQLSEENKILVEIFISKVAVAFENMELTQEIIETSKEILYTLGNVVESRSKETANHVQRVAEISHFLALQYGLDAKDALNLRNASPMHDVGKVGIEDRILLKPGKLDVEEFEEIKRHTLIGYEILKGSERETIKAAAIIAHEHHERWDGSGYPRGLSGENIHVFGRITAIVDVFDALYHKRCYKEPWSLEAIVEYITNEKGRQFDPKLVTLFLENIEEIVAIDARIS